MSHTTRPVLFQSWRRLLQDQWHWAPYHAPYSFEMSGDIRPQHELVGPYAKPLADVMHNNNSHNILCRCVSRGCHDTLCNYYFIVIPALTSALLKWVELCLNLSHCPVTYPAVFHTLPRPFFLCNLIPLQLKMTTMRWNTPPPIAPDSVGVSL